MTTELYIQNLKCGGCAQTIMNALQRLSGVTKVSVSLENSCVGVHHASEDQLQEIESTLSKLGYPIDGAKNPLSKKAKSFVSCAIGRMSKPNNG
ncbi:MAG: hypothetical protein Aureis2KO_15460 [Aureisphaera sp.]